MFRTGMVAAAVTLAIGVVSAQPDVLATLGTTPRDAQDGIFSSVATGVPALPGERSVFKGASSERRAAMTRGVISIARTFIASPDFSRRYALYRDTQRPQRSSAVRNGDQARLHQQQAIEIAVKEAMANAAQLPPDTRKRLDESIADMRRQIAELNADASYRAQIDQAAAAAAQEDDAELARQLAVFENEFPENPDTLIARRLRQFLLACSDIDFTAKLEQGADQKMHFVNAAYERRSREWKMCYRAGKPAVDAARAAAEEWLNTLTSVQNLR